LEEDRHKNDLLNLNIIPLKIEISNLKKGVIENKRFVDAGLKLYSINAKLSSRYCSNPASSRYYVLALAQGVKLSSEGFCQIVPLIGLAIFEDLGIGPNIKLSNLSYMMPSLPLL
jgi:hypothetical protein